MDVLVKSICYFLFLLFLNKNIITAEESPAGEVIYGKWDEEKTLLRKKLLSNYDKCNPPISGEFKNVTEVWVYLVLRFVNEYDEVSGHLESTVMIQTWWKDTRLTRNSSVSNFTDDKEGLVFNVKDIWVPNLILWNPVESFVIMDPQNDRLLAKAYPDAYVFYLIGGKLTTHCVPNVKYYPFDKHECFIDLIVYESLYYPKVIDLKISSPMKFEFSENPQWFIEKGTPEIKDFLGVGIYVARFPFLLERRPYFLLFNLIAPILLLSLINVCVFAIPIDSGERNSFAITVFLALAVYMTVVADSIPHSSNPMPLWSYFLFFKLIYSACIALFSTIVVRLSSKITPVPKWLLVIISHCKLCKSQKKQVMTDAQEAGIINSCKQNYEENSDYRNYPGTGSKNWRYTAYVIDKCLLVIFLMIAMLEILLTFIFTATRK